MLLRAPKEKGKEEIGKLDRSASNGRRRCTMGGALESRDVPTEPAQ